MPAFAIAVTAAPGVTRCALMPPMFTTRAWSLWRSAGSAARISPTAPATFVSIPSWMPSGVSSTAGPPPKRPALFTTASSRPRRAITAAGSAPTASASVTSTVNHDARSSPSSATASSPSSSLRPHIATIAPSPAADRAIARPMPRFDPVTRTTRPCSPRSMPATIGDEHGRIS